MRHAFPRSDDRSPTLLMVAHGTRDPAGVAAGEALLDRVRALRPGLRVRLAHLDLAAPSVASVLAALTGEVVLVPLLLGTGYHLRVDLPAAVAAAPHLRARTAAALGPHPLLAEALADRLAEAGRPRSAGPVVLAAAGSSDPAAVGDTERMARLLAVRLGTRVVPSYLGGRGPATADVVAALRAEGHGAVSVACYLTTPGHFARRAVAAGAAAGAAFTAAPLGAHEAVARLVLRRGALRAGSRGALRAGLRDVHVVGRL
ncbi:sirohydrochlorin chelatase [Streptomyces sp. URMC 123]|uniref:sirohydrochlorin chelatase n=1 Tax=Streptomyces sp. URMC 123 TaxID=3423403 RepID=UPI003F198AC6